MPQPEGSQLAEVRAHRERLREKYLRPRGERPHTTVQGVHHLALICRDVEETIQFYQEFLGFPLVELVEKILKSFNIVEVWPEKNVEAA